MTTKLTALTDFLNTILHTENYTDIALNGLQIESSQHNITRVGLAVDAGLSVITKAVEQNVDLLITHHGVLWGQVQAITGAFARKISLCLQNGLSLYSVHLPLDGHSELGNAAQIASSILGLHSIQSAYEYKGAPLGITGSFEKATSLESIIQILGRCEGALNPPHLLAFGSSKIKTVGIVTGSGSSCIKETAQCGLDLLITGESKQEAYHEAKELNCNVIFMGHYASETFGVRALGNVLTAKFGVETVWISEPTGI